MGTEVLEVNMPGELVMWLHLAGSGVSMGQSEAGIILDYLKEHNMALAVHNQELVVKDMGEESPEYRPYSIDDAIHDVCEWNLELIDEMEDGMKNPDCQEDYNRFSDAHGILKQQEEVLDGLYKQTKYEQIAVECAMEVITLALGEIPEGVREKMKIYSQGRAERSEGEKESVQEFMQRRQERERMR